MHILHLGKYYFPVKGGIETAVKNLAEIAVSLNHRVTCIVSNNINNNSSETINNVEVIRLATLFKKLSTPFSFAYFGISLKKYSLIHIHLPHPFAEMRVLLQIIFFLTPKIIPFIHAIPVSQGILGKIWFYGVTRVILNHSESILISNSALLKSFPILQKWSHKIVVLPFYTKTISENDLNLYSLNREKKFTVSALGRLVPYKGFGILLQAWYSFQSQKKNNDSCVLKIAGEGPEKENLKKMVQCLFIESSVQFLGEINDLEKQKLLEESSLFVAPSTSKAETFGISVLEAMAYGLPVVTTNLDTGLSELARNGECGATVPINDFSSIANVFLNFQKNSKQYQEKGKNNLYFVRSNYSEQQFRERYHDIIESVK